MPTTHRREVADAVPRSLNTRVITMDSIMCRKPLGLTPSSLAHLFSDFGGTHKENCDGEATSSLSYWKEHGGSVVCFSEREQLYCIQIQHPCLSALRE